MGQILLGVLILFAVIELVSDLIAFLNEPHVSNLTAEDRKKFYLDDHDDHHGT